MTVITEEADTEDEDDEIRLDPLQGVMTVITVPFSKPYVERA